MIRVLAAAEPMTVTIDGKRTTIWMLFVGNGRYSPADQVPMSRPEMNRGLLDVRYLRADKKNSRAHVCCLRLPQEHWAARGSTFANSSRRCRFESPIHR